MGKEKLEQSEELSCQQKETVDRLESQLSSVKEELRTECEKCAKLHEQLRDVQSQKEMELSDKDSTLSQLTERLNIALTS